ncbi:MAG: hypothetical protein J7M40_06405, partial [Planctomycetes bacterium]|nr:hypothetical protein [Planctomycetota bacterium]
TEQVLEKIEKAHPCSPNEKAGHRENPVPVVLPEMRFLLPTLQCIRLNPADESSARALHLSTAKTTS